MKALHTPRFGAARIAVEPSGFYQPVNEGGIQAVVLGVADRAGELVDLVAWEPESPWQWWVRRSAMQVLGEGEIHRAHFLDAPLYLFATPQDWLFNHDARGYWPAACVLDWTIDPRVIFAGIRLVCHGNGVAARLEEAQRRHDRPLNIQVAWNEAESVAA